MTTDDQSFWALVGVVIGVCTWGNEPDIFRYGKPRLWASLGAYGFGLSSVFCCSRSAAG